MNEYAEQFVDKGFTVLDLSSELARWANDMRSKADIVTSAKGFTDGWCDYGRFEVAQLPEVQLLRDTLSQVLKEPSCPGTMCQLSALKEGFGSAQLNRHVDGANGGLAWSGLLLSVNLVDIPSDKPAGQLIVWPGTHWLTQERFNSLGGNPTETAVQRAILGHGAVGRQEELYGRAGTVALIDHRLEHAMASHRTVDLVRQVVYFRLPGYTSDPREVVDSRHFLMHG